MGDANFKKVLPEWDTEVGKGKDGFVVIVEGMQIKNQDNELLGAIKALASVATEMTLTSADVVDAVRYKLSDRVGELSATTVQGLFQEAATFLEGDMNPEGKDDALIAATEKEAIAKIAAAPAGIWDKASATAAANASGVGASAAAGGNDAKNAADAAEAQEAIAVNAANAAKQAAAEAQQAVADANQAVTDAKQAAKNVKKFAKEAKQAATKENKAEAEKKAKEAEKAAKAVTGAKTKVQQAVTKASTAVQQATEAEQKAQEASKKAVEFLQKAQAAVNDSSDADVIRAQAAVTKAVQHKTDAATEKNRAVASEADVRKYETAVGVSETEAVTALADLPEKKKKTEQKKKTEKKKKTKKGHKAIEVKEEEDALKAAQAVLDAKPYTIPALQDAFDKLTGFKNTSGKATVKTNDMLAKLETEKKKLNDQVIAFIDTLARIATGIAFADFDKKTLEDIENQFPEIQRINDSKRNVMKNDIQPAAAAVFAWLKKEEPKNLKGCKKYEHIVKFLVFGGQKDPWEPLYTSARKQLLDGINKDPEQTDAKALLAKKVDLTVVEECEKLRKIWDKKYGIGKGGGIPEDVLDRLQELAEPPDLPGDQIEHALNALEENDAIDSKTRKLLEPLDYLRSQKGDEKKDTFEDMMLFHAKLFLTNEIKVWAAKVKDGLGDFDKDDLSTLDETHWKKYGHLHAIVTHWVNKFKKDELAINIQNTVNAFDPRRTAQRKGHLTRSERNALEISYWLLPLLS